MSENKDSLLQFFHNIGLRDYDLGLFVLTILVVILVVPDIIRKNKVSLFDKVIDTWVVLLFLFFLFAVINEHFLK